LLSLIFESLRKFANSFFFCSEFQVQHKH
jgi:hypothetical protein